MELFFKSLALMPWYVQITAVIFAVLFFIIRDKVFTLIKEKVMVLWTKDNASTPSSPVSNKKKFTREEVLSILFDNTESHIYRMHSDIHDIYKKRLEQQMVLADQLLDAFLSLLNDSFATQLKDKESEMISSNIKVDKLRIIEQKQTYYVIAKLILDSYVRNELRRIFKYNGFHDLDEDAWEEYKFNKFQSVINILLNKLTSEYPNTMYLPFSDNKAYILEHNKKEMRILFSEMMDNVKQKYLLFDDKVIDIKNDTRDKIQQTKDQLGI